MAPIGLYEALGGSLGNEQDYLSQNPWYMSGVGMAKSQLPAPTNKWEAIFGPMAQGLITGSLLGYGKNQARDTAYGDYAPIVSALSGVPMAEERPEDWTFQSGKSELMAALLGASQKQENILKQREYQNEINKALMSKGAMMDDSGKIVAIPGLDTIQAANTASEATAKELGRINALRSLSNAGTDDSMPLDPEERKKAVRDLEDTTYTRITNAPSFKQFSDIEASFNTLVTLKDKESAAAAPAMITSFARILDPTSTVREGEYATINKNVQGYLDSVAGNWRKAFKGETSLSKEAREAMVAIAADKYNEFGQKYAGERSPLLDALKAQGGDPSHIPTPEFKRFDLGGSAPPPGMKLQRNRVTGETRLVPQ